MSMSGKATQPSLRCLSRRTCLSALTGLFILVPGVACATTETRTTDYDYDAQGRPIKELLQPNSGATCQATDIGYDLRGNRNSNTVRTCNSAENAGLVYSGSWAVSRTTTIAYGDGQMRFPTRIQNPAGEVETRIYDARFGQPTTITTGLLANDAGQIGLTTTTSYDGFGRVISQTPPEGGVTETNYELCADDVGCSVTGINAGGVYRTFVTQTNAPTRAVYFDAMHRQVLTEVQGAATSGMPPWIYTRKTYDTQGRILADTRPYFDGQTPQVYGPISSANYDILGRVTDEITANGKHQSYLYSSINTTMTVVDVSPTQSTTKKINSRGWLVSVTDAAGSVLIHTYTPFGLLNRTTDPEGNSINIGYDVRGRKISVDDPDLGQFTYSYNTAGDLLYQYHWSGEEIWYDYDPLGRMTKRTEGDLVSEWSYDRNFDGSRCQYGVGAICQSRSDNGYLNSQTFDSAGRPSSATTTIGDANFSVGTTYLTGTKQPASKIYPTGLVVLNSYSPQGYLMQVANDNGQMYWQADTRDAEGHLALQHYGNGVYTTTTYDGRTGLFTSVLAGAGNNVQDLHFVGSQATGNLTQREDRNQNLIESLQYDNLNRLTQSIVNASAVTPPSVTSFGYDSIGNLICKSDLSPCSAGSPNYQYGPSISIHVDDDRWSYNPPHAVAQITGTVHGTTNPGFYYDSRGNLISDAGRNVNYTSFNMPLTMSKSGFSTQFTYGPDHQRVRQVSTGGGVTRTLLYLHPDQANGLLYERETFNAITTHNHYITAEGQVVALVTLENGAWATKYFHRDNLGSVTALTNEAGTVIERTAYDSWGKRRFPNGQSDPADSIHADPSVRYNTDRGYTNHEMLDELGLIHMNGRVFDPAIARFITPDPTVPNPEWLQDYNRFTYVQNNPFTETDPTGFGDGDGDDNQGAHADTTNPTADGPTQTISDNTPHSSENKGSKSAEAPSNGVAGVGASVVLDEIPGVSFVKGLFEVIAGRDYVAGQDVNRGTALAGLVLAAFDVKGLATAARAARAAAKSAKEEQAAAKLAARAEEEAKALKSEKAKTLNEKPRTSREARRQAMRDQGLPTSQQPVSQSRNASGREYSYDVPAPGGGTERASVQQQTMDRGHQEEPHWEAGRAKTDPLTGQTRENNYGRPALTNDKSKVNY